MAFNNPNETNIIITLAINIPKSAAKKDFFLSISNTAAIKHPVQAPVPGSGIPTNSTNPQNPYFSILFLCLCTFSSNLHRHGHWRWGWRFLWGT